jgi:hypothetical protein
MQYINNNNKYMIPINDIKNLKQPVNIFTNFCSKLFIY